MTEPKFNVGDILVFNYNYGPRGKSHYKIIGRGYRGDAWIYILDFADSKGGQLIYLNRHCTEVEYSNEIKSIGWSTAEPTLIHDFNFDKSARVISVNNHSSDEDHGGLQYL